MLYEEYTLRWVYSSYHHIIEALLGICDIYTRIGGFTRPPHTHLFFMNILKNGGVQRHKI